MANDHVVHGFFRDCEAIHPSIPTDSLHLLLVSPPSFPLDPPVIFSSISPSLFFLFHFSTPTVFPPHPATPLHIPLPLPACPPHLPPLQPWRNTPTLSAELGPQHNSSTLLFMAAGAESEEVEPTMEYGDY